MTDTHEKITPSSGCVFADLGVERPEFLEQAMAALRLADMRSRIPGEFTLNFEGRAVIVAKALSQAHQDGIREGKRQAAEIARAAEIPPSDNEEPGDDEWWTRCAANGQAAQIARDILSTIPDESE